MTFRFSQKLDSDALRSTFSQQGFVHIPVVLPPENANRIHKALLESTPWSLVFNDG